MFLIDSSRFQSGNDLNSFFTCSHIRVLLDEMLKESTRNFQEVLSSLHNDPLHHCQHRCTLSAASFFKSNTSLKSPGLCYFLPIIYSVCCFEVFLPFLYLITFIPILFLETFHLISKLLVGLGKCSPFCLPLLN